MFLTNLFSKPKTISDKDEIIKALRISPETFEKFENSYRSFMADKEGLEPNAKLAVARRDNTPIDVSVNDIVNRIVDELLAQTIVLKFDGKTCRTETGLINRPENPVTLDEIMALPEHLRPQLTGTLVKKDMNENNGEMLLSQYLKSCDETVKPKVRKEFYNLFRQGLDILDLDWLMYEMIDTNVISMGHWLPQLINAVVPEGFFNIPKTTIIKVPLPLLQLTRIEWEMLTQTTLDIVNKYCMKAFELDPDGDYFIKTGTYSSKFDFRNAHVTTPKEVRELGSYLVYIHYAALLKAGALNKPCIYGISTTTEWVVRDFIKDPDNNLTIYHGLPLRTEYRAFVDFDTKTVLGITPYWDPDIMKARFANCDNPDDMHDYVTYSMNEDILTKRFDDNKDNVAHHLDNIVKTITGIHGQWSIDIMQNGADFYIIDMATAARSALKEKINYDFELKEDWIPVITEK
jgi:hypothetical protein